MIRSHNFLRGIFVVMVSSALSNCGRDQSEDAFYLDPPHKINTPGYDQPESSTAEPQEPKFKVLRNSSTLRSASINDRHRDFCALFLILPNIEGLEVLDVKVDGLSFYPSKSRDLNFNKSYVEFGRFDAKAAEPMCNSEVGLTASDKNSLVQDYDQGLYAYFKIAAARFFAPGYSHSVKIVAGKNAVKMGEFEFAVQND